VGRSRVAVSNLLRLLELPDEIIAAIEKGTLSEGHGRALLLAKDRLAQRRLARTAAAEGWSVRVLEDRARRSNEASGSAKGAGRAKGRGKQQFHPDQEAAAAEIAEVFSEVLGSDAGVRPTADGGYRVELAFASRDEALAVAHRLRARGSGR